METQCTFPKRNINGWGGKSELQNVYLCQYRAVDNVARWIEIEIFSFIGTLRWYDQSHCLVMLHFLQLRCKPID